MPQNVRGTFLISGSHANENDRCLRPILSAVPQALLLPLLRFDPLSFLFYRGLFMKTPVFQFPEKAVVLHLPFEQPDCFLNVFIINSYFQD